MSISGLVLHVRPERVSQVSSEIIRIQGVEVHAVGEGGKMVVTVDCPDDKDATETFTKLGDVEGVLATSLIYNYFETDTAANQETLS